MGKFETQANVGLPAADTVRQPTKCTMPRKYRAMFGEIAWIFITVGLVICTYYWGLYAAIGAVSACGSAMICRIIHYITMKERKNNGCC